MAMQGTWIRVSEYFEAAATGRLQRTSRLFRTVLSRDALWCLHSAREPPRLWLALPDSLTAAERYRRAALLSQDTEATPSASGPPVEIDGPLACVVIVRHEDEIKLVARDPFVSLKFEEDPIERVSLNIKGHEMMFQEEEEEDDDDEEFDDDGRKTMTERPSHRRRRRRRRQEGYAT